jgi:hypothetical protein
LVQADRAINNEQNENLLLTYRVVDVEDFTVDETQQSPFGVVNVAQAGKFRQVLSCESVDFALKFISMSYAVLALVTIDFLKGIFRCWGDNNLHA